MQTSTELDILQQNEQFNCTIIADNHLQRPQTLLDNKNDMARTTLGSHRNNITALWVYKTNYIIFKLQK